MSLAPDDTDSATTPAERRARLAVLCALDRAALKLALRAPEPSPAPSSASAPAGETLRRALAAGRFFPGAIGRWSRRLSVGAGLIGLFR